jgi:hypothetical protein
MKTKEWANINLENNTTYICLSILDNNEIDVFVEGYLTFAAVEKLFGIMQKIKQNPESLKEYQD